MTVNVSNNQSTITINDQSGGVTIGDTTGQTINVTSPNPTAVLSGGASTQQVTNIASVGLQGPRGFSGISYIYLYTRSDLNAQPATPTGGVWNFDTETLDLTTVGPANTWFLTTGEHPSVALSLWESRAVVNDIGNSTLDNIVWELPELSATGPAGPTPQFGTPIVTSVANGNPALVTIDDTNIADVIVSFTIPAGEQGPIGITGNQGIQGVSITGVQFTETAVVNNNKIVDVTTALSNNTTVASGSLTILGGRTGAQGNQGDQGIGISTLTSAPGLPGTDTTVTATFNNPVLGSTQPADQTFTIAAGSVGATGSQGDQGISIDTITSTNSGVGTDSAVTITLDDPAGTTIADQTFTIPAGAQGTQGIQGIQGVQGDQGISIDIISSANSGIGTNSIVTVEFTDPAGTNVADQTFTIPPGAQGVQGLRGLTGATGLGFSVAEQTKLAGIEDSATADQTDAEIKTAYENNTDTNAFTDAEKTKLTNIEDSATADQTSLEIKTAYESNTNTNAFTDAEQTKLTGIETGAEVNTVKSIIDGIGIASTNNSGDITIAVDAGVTQGKVLVVNNQDRIPVIDGSLLTNLSPLQLDTNVDATEFGFLDGVTSSIQTQIDSKEPSVAMATTSDYYRGDKTFQALETNVVTENTNLYYTQARFDTAFTAKDTDGLTEGTTNQYYTDTRVRSSISAPGTDGLSYNDTTGEFTLAQDISTTASPTFADISASNISVSGTITTNNQTNLALTDTIIELSSFNVTPTINDGFDRGVEFNYFDTAQAKGFWGWDNSTNKFTYIPEATNTLGVFSGTVGTFDLSGTSINEHSDVTITTPVDNQVLQYESGVLVNKTIVADITGSVADELGDVDAGATENQILVRNNTDTYVPQTVYTWFQILTQGKKTGTTSAPFVLGTTYNAIEYSFKEMTSVFRVRGGIGVDRVDGFYIGTVSNSLGTSLPFASREF